MANCSISWGSFQGNVPDQWVHYFMFHCSSVFLLGTVINVLALWCVVSCPRTRHPVKVLLCVLFSSTLFMCVLVMPFMVSISALKLRCDLDVSIWLIRIIVLLYTILTEVELFHILIMAFLRALAVWSPQRHQVKLRTAWALVLGVISYTILSLLALLVPYYVDVEFAGKVVIAKVYNFVHFLLPVIITLCCYSSMIVAVRLNKHRLAASHHKEEEKSVMDQATRAMLAVFVSNLLLGLPHSLYHILPIERKVYSYVIMHCVFFTHLLVDPLVFICFNLYHRQRVLDFLHSCLHCCRPRPSLQAVSTLPLNVTPTASSDERREEERDVERI